MCEFSKQGGHCHCACLDLLCSLHRTVGPTLKCGYPFLYQPQSSTGNSALAVGRECTEAFEFQGKTINTGEHAFPLTSSMTGTNNINVLYLFPYLYCMVSSQIEIKFVFLVPLVPYKVATVCIYSKCGCGIHMYIVY